MVTLWIFRGRWHKWFMVLWWVGGKVSSDVSCREGTPRMCLATYSPRCRYQCSLSSEHMDSLRIQQWFCLNSVWCLLSRGERQLWWLLQRRDTTIGYFFLLTTVLMSMLLTKWVHDYSLPSVDWNLHESSLVLWWVGWMVYRKDSSNVCCGKWTPRLCRYSNC